MTVVLLDPTWPDMIPAGAAKALADGHVYVTEDVHPTLLWHLGSYERADSVDQYAENATLLTSDDKHPIAADWIARGAQIVSGHPVPGSQLIKAVALMDQLRRTGPWEKRQTHDSLRRYLLEEVYELLDAFDDGTAEELCSELGDLLLQVLFHARIAEDSAITPFDIDDVAKSFIDKVSGRTPGVLSGEHADLERQIREWEEAKAAERQRGSVLDGIVTSQPALALTQKVFERLAGADFPVEAISPALSWVEVAFTANARDSVEDQQRRNALKLIQQVRAAEEAAARDGVVPRTENAWRKYLGMQIFDHTTDDLDDEPTSPAEPVEGPPEIDDATTSPAEPGDEGARVEALDSPPTDTAEAPAAAFEAPFPPSEESAEATAPDDTDTVDSSPSPEPVEAPAAAFEAPVAPPVDAETPSSPDGTEDFFAPAEQARNEVEGRVETPPAPPAAPPKNPMTPTGIDFSTAAPGIDFPTFAFPGTPSAPRPTPRPETPEETTDEVPVVVTVTQTWETVVEAEFVETPPEDRIGAEEPTEDEIVDVDEDRGFPGLDDFPAPPRPRRTVGTDPIADEDEREVDLEVGDDVPRMVVTERWSMKGERD